MAIDPLDLEPGDVVEATVKLRRGGRFVVKPTAEVLDGVRMRFRYGFGFFDDEFYSGEVAMFPLSPEARTVTGWIASGDLADMVIVDPDAVSFDGGGTIEVPGSPEPLAVIVVHHS